jgi:hypothetical protein
MYLVSYEQERDGNGEYDIAVPIYFLCSSNQKLLELVKSILKEHCKCFKPNSVLIPLLTKAISVGGILINEGPFVQIRIQDLQVNNTEIKIVYNEDWKIENAIYYREFENE